MLRHCKQNKPLLFSKNDLSEFVRHNETGQQLPGLNIQEPWCSLLLTGGKSVETRGYDCPVKMQGVVIGAVATQRKATPKSALLGLIKVTATKLYKSEEEFEADMPLHLVERECPYWFSPTKQKWGWAVEVIAVLETPLIVTNRRGIVWTQNVIF